MRLPSTDELQTMSPEARLAAAAAVVDSVLTSGRAVEQLPALERVLDELRGTAVAATAALQLARLRMAQGRALEAAALMAGHPSRHARLVLDSAPGSVGAGLGPLVDALVAGLPGAADRLLSRRAELEGLAPPERARMGEALGSGPRSTDDELRWRLGLRSVEEGYEPFRREPADSRGARPPTSPTMDDIETLLERVSRAATLAPSLRTGSDLFVALVEHLGAPPFASCWTTCDDDRRRRFDEDLAASWRRALHGRNGIAQEPLPAYGHEAGLGESDARHLSALRTAAASLLEIEDGPLDGPLLLAAEVQGRLALAQRRADPDAAVASSQRARALEDRAMLRGHPAARSHRVERLTALAVDLAAVDLRAVDDDAADLAREGFEEAMAAAGGGDAMPARAFLRALGRPGGAAVEALFEPSQLRAVEVASVQAGAGVDVSDGLALIEGSLLRDEQRSPHFDLQGVLAQLTTMSFLQDIPAAVEFACMQANELRGRDPWDALALLDSVPQAMAKMWHSDPARLRVLAEQVEKVDRAIVDIVVDDLMVQQGGISQDALVALSSALARSGPQVRPRFMGALRRAVQSEVSDPAAVQGWLLTGLEVLDDATASPAERSAWAADDVDALADGIFEVASSTLARASAIEGGSPALVVELAGAAMGEVVERWQPERVDALRRSVVGAAHALQASAHPGCTDSSVRLLVVLAQVEEALGAPATADATFREAVRRASREGVTDPAEPARSWAKVLLARGSLASEVERGRSLGPGRSGRRATLDAPAPSTADQDGPPASSAPPSLGNVIPPGERPAPRAGKQAPWRGWLR